MKNIMTATLVACAMFISTASAQVSPSINNHGGLHTCYAYVYIEPNQFIDGSYEVYGQYGNEFVPPAPFWVASAAVLSENKSQNGYITQLAVAKATEAACVGGNFRVCDIVTITEPYTNFLPIPAGGYKAICKK